MAIYVNGVEQDGEILEAGATTELLVGGGAGVAPVWTTATGTGAPVRAGDPAFTGFPTTPVAAPDADYEVANKKYVDDNAGGDVATDEIWDAAGDLIQGTGADTAAKLSKGSALALLKMNAGGTAVEWGTAGQIAFPATAAPSGDANTLDDYEEGSWEPGLEFGGAAVGITYHAYNGGTYVKIGKVVCVFGYLFLSNKGSSNGQAVITNLPFSGSAGAWHAGPLAVRSNKITWNTTPNLQVSGTTITLTEVSGGTVSTVTDVDFANDSSALIAGVYSTDQ